MRPVPFTRVSLADDFWKPMITRNRKVTIPFGFNMSEETGRINNFRIAAGNKKGAFCSVYPFDDSDVYKIIEGASYALQQDPDDSLAGYLDNLIAQISAAQEPDGYLQTWRIIDPDKPGDDWWGERERWTGIMHGHELYNMGHLYEAAVAHYQATGKRTLLDVALRNADLVVSTFGPGGRVAVPGHEEIEIGLVKLYRLTGDTAYLNTARFFVDERGVGTGRELFGTYHQDHMPVREQREAVGHAVRAGYLYSAMADLAAITGDTSYLPALNSIWEDIVYRKMYITGGAGARKSGESFGDPYELPNATAYAETCAAIAMVLWNHRMFLMTGEGRYYDVLERTLYNGLISGVSRSGDRFFYPNPLASDGKTAFNYGSATRQPWFPCACCPSNISRILPSVPAYFYAVKSDTVYVNLYASGMANPETGSGNLRLRQETDYPWNGDVRLTVMVDDPADFTLALRIPGWARGEPVPGDLYEFMDPGSEGVELYLNDTILPVSLEEGYVFLERKWFSGEEIRLRLPMPVRRIRAHPAVSEDRGAIALQRGPLVYCLEEADNGPVLDRIRLSEKAVFSISSENNSMGSYTSLRIEDGDRQLKAIPYYLWSNRGPGEMTVWIPYE